MYKEDLAVLMESGNDTYITVGWLTDTIRFKESFTLNKHRKNLISRLYYCNKYATIRMSKEGHHECDYCHFDESERTFNFAEIGNGEILIRDKNKRNVIYVAPTMICHYVDIHGYVPPMSFVESVLYASDDDLLEFKRIEDANK